MPKDVMKELYRQVVTFQRPFNVALDACNMPPVRPALGLGFFQHLPVYPCTRSMIVSGCHWLHSVGKVLGRELDENVTEVEQHNQEGV